MQRVDFLSDLPKEKEVVSFTHFLLALLVAMVLCAIISFYLIIWQFLANRELKQIEQKRTQAAVSFQDVAKRYPLLASEVPLDKKLKQLANQLSQRQKDFESISHTTLRTGFSEYMTTLAVVTPANLWLTEITINQDLKEISIQGMSQKASEVASLIQKLNDSDAFKGLNFDLFNVEWNREKRILAFEIANEELKSTTESDEEDEEKMSSKVVKARVLRAQGVVGDPSI